MKKRYKNHQAGNLFDREQTLEELISLGNPLTRLSQVIDFEIFRDLIETKFYGTEPPTTVGAPPFDVVLMFKIMLLQRFYGLGDDVTEYQIKDRTSFRDFLGIMSVDGVPDSSTIWLFRERLVESGAIEELFDSFSDYLRCKGLSFTQGKIIDASFVICPRQKNSKEEKAEIKAGHGKELWKDNPHKKCHKDIDAGWTLKNGIPYYGYKNHVKIDNTSKLIETYLVTSASQHDSDAPRDLLTQEDKGQKIYGDSAYSGLGYLFEKKGVLKEVCARGQRSHPLTKEQRLENKRISKTRARVEHVFGFMEGAMHGLVNRLVGIARARTLIGLTNLFYNMFRYEQIVRYELCGIKKADFTRTSKG